MKISLSWLSDYLDVAPLKKDFKGILEKLTMRGLEVEAVEDLSKGFEKVIVAQIETRDPHPDADRLSVCRVNTGKETLQIVCGAKNMKAGDKVALSMIGALLPNGLKIEKGKIRGVESFGMLCSEVELGIADKSEGILILSQDAQVGEPLAPYIGLDDVMFEINVTPNRGDALSFIGVARELAAILGRKVNYPDTRLKESDDGVTAKVKVRLENPTSAPDLCLQYHGRYIEGVKIGPSPGWLRKRLKSVGLRPINNVVDVTNFVMMEWGTPLHAFDYARVKGGEIRVRLARKGEKLPLLDGTEVTLTDEDLVIADSEKPVALAGVMGGGNSEVSANTTALLLETAQFDPAAIRRASKRHQKKTDSSHRFERQIDARAVAAASERAAALIADVAGGKVFKGAVSVHSPKGKKLISEDEESRTRIGFKLSDMNRFLGSNISDADVVKALDSIGFQVTIKGDDISVTSPSYRPDVQLKEDVYEEVLRVWGYDRVEPVVPKLDYIPDRLNAVDARVRVLEKLKTAFVQQGFCETVNYAFTSKVAAANWSKKPGVPIANPLNEELTTMRTSLLSGLFENLLRAVHHQADDMRFFEVRPVYFLNEKSETGVREEWRVAGLMTGRGFVAGLAAHDRDADFYDAKGAVESALETIGCRGLRFEAADENQDAPMHPAQTASILLGRGPCGFVGRLHPKFEMEHKLRHPVYVFEFDLERALEMAKAEKKYSPISKFPKVPRDLSLLVPDGTTSDRVVLTIQKLGKPLVECVSVVDLYRGEKIPQGTLSLSVSMVLGDPNRTLEEVEVERATQTILSGLEKELSVKLRVI